MSSSLAALVLNGPLAPDLCDGIVLVFLGSTVVAGAIALFSSAPGAAAIRQDAPAVVVAVMDGTTVAHLTKGADAGGAFATVVVVGGVAAVAAVLTGPRSSPLVPSGWPMSFAPSRTPWSAGSSRIPARCCSLAAWAS